MLVAFHLVFPVLRIGFVPFHECSTTDIGNDFRSFVPELDVLPKAFWFDVQPAATLDEVPPFWLLFVELLDPFVSISNVSRRFTNSRFFAKIAAAGPSIFGVAGWITLISFSARFRPRRKLGWFGCALVWRRSTMGAGWRRIWRSKPKCCVMLMCGDRSNFMAAVRQITTMWSEIKKKMIRTKPPKSLETSSSFVPTYRGMKTCSMHTRYWMQTIHQQIREPQAFI